MSADIAFHWWFLLIILIAFVGLALGRFIDGVPAFFRIIVIGGMLSGLVAYRLIHNRKRLK